MTGGSAGFKPPHLRTAHLTDDETSRDIFGVARGACKACTSCGRFMKRTAEYTVAVSDVGRKHPDNDIRVTYCSRCGCPPEAHVVEQHENERQLGNDAFVLRQYDQAIVHYSRAIQHAPTDATLFSNRSAAYAAKGWGEQALADAARALALAPDWAKAWGRKGAALLVLRRPAEAVQAYQRGCKLNPRSTALQQGLRQARQAVARASSQQAVRRQPPPPAAASACPPVVAIKQQAAENRSAASTSNAMDTPASSAGDSPSDQQLPQPDLLELWRDLQAQHAQVLVAVAGMSCLMDQFASALQSSGHQLATHAQAVPPPAAPCTTSFSQPAGISSEPVAAQCWDGMNTEQEALGCAASAAASDGTGGQPEPGRFTDEPSEGLPASLAAAEIGDASLDDADAAASLREGLCSITTGTECPGSPSGSSSDSSSAAGSPRSSSTGTDRYASSHGSAEEDDLGWLRAVQQARAKLAGTAASPPLRAATASAAAGGTPPIRPVASSGSSRSLQLNDLASLCAAAAPPLRKDPGGVLRVACKRCGSQRCPGFQPGPLHLGPDMAAALFSRSPGSNTLDPALLLQGSQTCAVCGCSCSTHETEQEAAQRKRRQNKQEQRVVRQAQVQARAKQAQQAQAQQVQPRATAEASAAGARSDAAPHAAMQARRQRVLAAQQRREEAEAAGEVLQVSNADVLTQAQRAGCSSCHDCPSFAIHFRSSDANNPGVMFFCSLCGCDASSHEVDKSWSRAEEQRKAAETAAAQTAAARRAAAAAAAASAAAAVRQEELDALALLELPPTADARAVRASYKRLALTCHPDKAAGGSPAALAASSDRFHRLTQAYHKLLASRG